MKAIVSSMSFFAALGLFVLLLHLMRFSPGLARLAMGLCPFCLYVVAHLKIHGQWWPKEHENASTLAGCALFMGVAMAVKRLPPWPLDTLLALFSAGLTGYLAAARLVLPALEQAGAARISKEGETKAQARSRAQEAQNGEERRESAARFQELLIRILVLVALADGHFTKAQLAVILDFFREKLGYDERQMVRVKLLAKRAMDYPGDMGALLTEFEQRFSYTSLLILMELVYALIYTKDPPLPEELRLAGRMAQQLGIFKSDLRNIRAKYRDRRTRTEEEQEQQGRTSDRDSKDQRRGAGASDRRTSRSGLSPAEAEAFAILGLEPGAGLAEIKKAYRRMVVQYHPDKVAHLGQEFQRVAEEKMKEINVAYEILRQSAKG